MLAPSEAFASVSRVQQDLFDQPPEVDLDADPYADTRAAGRRLAAEFVIDEDEGFDLVLAFGSEECARRALVQRWYRDEVRLRSEAA